MKYQSNKRSPAGLAVYEENTAAMYARDKWRCRFCNTSSCLTPHHIVFQSQCGTDELDNLITLCIECHNLVHARRVVIVKNEVCSKFGGSYTAEFKRL